jgi:hypothetical protein
MHYTLAEIRAMGYVSSDAGARRILATTIVVLSSIIALGWPLGYRSIGGYLAFALLAASVALTAYSITRHVFPWHGMPDAVVRIGVGAFAIIVFGGLVLGGVGHLTLPMFCVLAVALLAASSSLTASRWRGAAVPKPAALPAPIVAVVAALLAFMIGFGATHSPLTLYDSLSYHLFFSARWLQDHRLSIIPTPFSDVAQAYAPANGELFFLWLMLPFHGDLLARMGQLPFCVLGAVTLYALSRRLGATPEQSVYPPAFFVLSRPVLEQAIGANVDLICAAMFLTSLYLGVVAADRNEPRDWILWGISFGLFLGTKYVALMYAPVLLLLVVARGPRIRAAWALPGIAAFGLPWYARNWIVAGSPIYPATLKIAGLTLARGAFDRAAMLNTVFHSTDLALLPAVVAHAFGPTLFLLWLPFAIVGGVAMARSGWWPAGFVLLATAAMVPLYWFGLPVNIDSRFLMPAIGPALLVFAFAFRRHPAWNMFVRGIYALGVIWILIGANTSIPGAVPWFMDGWLALDGLVPLPFVAWFGVAVLVMAMTWQVVAKRPGWAIPATAALVAAAGAALVVGGGRWCQPHGCEYLAVTSARVRPGLIDGWQWIAGNAKHSTIAYTGINLPYPLAGEQLTNRVVYVDIDGRPSWRFHDYDRAYRDGRFTPAPPVLATSSGELRPVGGSDGTHQDALRPRYERMQGFRDGWVFDLHKLGVAHLFVAMLSAYEIDYMWHNAEGFPVEDAWAAADPRSFRVEYENPQVRIYAVSQP